MAVTGQDTVVVVAGPTASGKSALALALARALDGVVINADALQVYRDLRIVTARPTPEQEEAAPHRLYGVLDAAEACSAGRWRDLALAEIAAAQAVGRRAILVGGTGLYLKALIDGIAEVPPIPAPIRAATRARLAELGAAGLHAELARRDPAGARRLAPGDSQRIARAFEVLEATGRPLAAWQADTTAATHSFAIVLAMPPRAVLVAAIERRLRRMVEAGALAEVQRLLARGLDPRLPAMKAVGLRELARHVRGELGLEAALAAAAAATRRYAKRQATWFRHQTPRQGSNIITMLTLEEQVSGSVTEELLSKIS